LAGLPATSANLAVIRDTHGKYVHFAEGPPLFFDLDADPPDLVDRSRARPEDAARYAARLLSWRMRHDDETLASWVLGDGGPRQRVDDPFERL
jgi:hypothetical protein